MRVPSQGPPSGGPHSRGGSQQRSQHSDTHTMSPHVYAARLKTRLAVKVHKKDRGTHKVRQVKLAEVANATCSAEDMNDIYISIEAAQDRGKRRITLSDVSDGIISSLLKAGFRIQRFTKGDSAAYIVNWTRGMVMFMSS